MVMMMEMVEMVMMMEMVVVMVVVEMVVRVEKEMVKTLFFNTSDLSS